MIIFLIGYMGSGKSTVGKALASKLNYNFTDLDSYIEQALGMEIVEIFEKEGEKKFRELEHNYLKGFLEKDKLVLSTGGGTPCFYDNMELMNKNGLTVYIKMSAEKLTSRLVNAKNKRPLIKDMSENDLELFIKSNLEKREPIYLMSQFKVKAGNLNVDELADFIKSEIGI